MVQQLCKLQLRACFAPLTKRLVLRHNTMWHSCAAYSRMGKVVNDLQTPAPAYNPSVFGLLILSFALQALHATVMESLRSASWYVYESFSTEKPAAVLGAVAEVTKTVQKTLQSN